MTDRSNQDDAGVPQRQASGLPSDLRLIKELAWRAGLLGLGLYLVLTDDPSRNLRLNALAYVLALIWCRYDGMLSRGRWGAAAFEAMIWYLIAIGFGRMALWLLGDPLAST
jgi:hypothetical protein